MCIVFWHQWVTPSTSPYRFIVAFNRDENFNRRTLPAHLLPDHPNVFAGRDLVGKGTWFGLSKNGRFACITNIRRLTYVLPAFAQATLLVATPLVAVPVAYCGAPLAAATVVSVAAATYYRLARHLRSIPSRGHLVLDFLTGDASPKDFIASIRGSSKACVGFNLLVADTKELWAYSNVADAPERVAPLAIGGLSNSVLRSPWPKVDRGVELLRPVVDGIQGQTLKDDDVVDKLFAVMRDTQQTGDSDPHPGTGWPSIFERGWARIWCPPRWFPPPYGRYGTRCSTVALLKWDGTAVVAERLYDGPTGEVVTHRHVVFAENGDKAGI